MRLHVEVDGPPDGAPVVFLHGVSGSMRTYAWLPARSPTGRRIVRSTCAATAAPSTPRGPTTSTTTARTSSACCARRWAAPPCSSGTRWAASSRGGWPSATPSSWPPPSSRTRRSTWASPPSTRTTARCRSSAPSSPPWSAGRRQGMTAEQAAAELAAAPDLRAALCDDVPLARAEALLRMDPGVLEGAIDRSTLAPTDTASPVSVPVFLLAADDVMGSAFAARHAERLAITPPRRGDRPRPRRRPRHPRRARAPRRLRRRRSRASSPRTPGRSCAAATCVTAAAGRRFLTGQRVFAGDASVVLMGSRARRAHPRPTSGRVRRDDAFSHALGRDRGGLRGAVRRSGAGIGGVAVDAVPGG